MLEDNIIYFSPSTNGFYFSIINGTNIPQDAVEITSELHHSLLSGQATGDKIVFNELTELPELQQQVSPENSEDILAFVVNRAKELIVESDWAMWPEMQVQNLQAFQAYRAALRDLIITPVVDPVWPVIPTPEWPTP